jgi:arginyl-tRNA synthetase
MQIIRDLVEKALEELKLETVEFSVTHPKEESHGDYSSNVAMILWGTLKVRPSLRKELTFGSPRELAEAIKEQLNHYTNTPLKHLNIKTLDHLVEKIEVAGAGFINFYLKPEFYLEETKKAIEPGFGKN